ncbi:hypothetical protein [Pseudomonas aeruginosa]|uniref:hypothetical protein n=1 Tax=Pseudomonas aeruginosa TaxID=287 RepID=UPI0029025C7C|nr:hypothetical protein [Pseudomonas aeruginosa]MDU0542817.1 hypothetical protein [Pseudomonas aeruginosa]
MNREDVAIDVTIQDKHPEQAGGDERAAFEQWEAEQIAFVLRQIGSMDADDIDSDNVDLRFEDASGRDTGCDVSIVDYAEKAANLIEAMLSDRAALAQPSPKCATCGGTGMVDDGEITCSEGGIPYENGPVKCVKDCPDCKAQPSPAQAEQAERPEVVARVVHSNPVVLGQCGPLNANDELMTVAQHAASVARWAEMFNRVEQERDAALARVAELETALEPFAAVADAYDDSEDDDHEPYTDMGCDDRLRLTLGQHRAGRIALEGRTPQAQAQQLHDLDKQCRDDVARALGLRPNQERGFAWSYLLASIKSCVKASGDSAQAQHSVPEGWKLVPIEPLLNMMSDKDHDTRITAERQLLSILADVPGNLVPQAWLDVQAERRRQITAEGWTPEHDDLYCAAELPRAAAAYILNGANDEAPAIWPFVAKWWKPRDARSNYVRAGALILAEIERLDRARQGGRS